MENVSMSRVVGHRERPPAAQSRVEPDRIEHTFCLGLSAEVKTMVSFGKGYVSITLMDHEHAIEQVFRDPAQAAVFFEMGRVLGLNAGDGKRANVPADAESAPANDVTPDAICFQLGERFGSVTLISTENRPMVEFELYGREEDGGPLREELHGKFSMRITDPEVAGVFRRLAEHLEGRPLRGFWEG